jgi:hypothetical protein
MQHCQQIVAKYRELGLRADYVHSLESTTANERVHRQLENHELDVIVQVRKLGEGFDHPYLSVAAVFSIFNSLGPFMQFVGRIMRVIPGVNPFSAVNNGVVVFHVGGNITGVWTDFQQFAEADQQFFAQLVDENLVEPNAIGVDEATRDIAWSPLPVITSQDDVLLEDLTLVTADPAVTSALEVLQNAGINTGERFDLLRRVTPTKQQSRRAKRGLLDNAVKNEAGKVLSRRQLNHVGRDLDRTRDNFRVVKSAIDRRIKQVVPSEATTRDEYTSDDYDQLMVMLPEIVSLIDQELRVE